MSKGISLRIPLEFGPRGLSFRRAAVKLRGIEQAGNSFEGRVFLDNPSADESTPLRAENGYVGSFHVYGYGLWPGDIGKQPSEVGKQHSKARAPIEKTVEATEALRLAGVSKASEVVVTVVPVYPGQPPKSALAELTLDGASIVIDPEETSLKSETQF